MKNIKLKYKIAGLAIGVVLTFVLLIIFYIIPTINNVITDRTKTFLNQTVELPISVINSNYELYKDGIISEEEAKELSMNQVKTLRYDGGTGYFWINDDLSPIPNMIMHTTAPTLDGVLLDDAKYNVAFGEDGNLFGAFVEVTKTDGDGGKGFGVVASEIKNLAESSSNMVENIKVVTDNVSEVVEKLVRDSKLMLEFIDARVLIDYQKLIEVSEQYNNDSISFNEIMLDLSATTEELFGSVDTILETVNDVAESTNSGADGIEKILSGTKEMSKDTQNFLAIAEENIAAANELDDMMKSFKL